MNRRIARLLSGRTGARLELHMLSRQTAKAFGVPAPGMAGASRSDRLRTYATFTAQASREAIESGRDLQALKRDLFTRAYRLGRLLRILLRPKKEAECVQILTLIYRTIGMDIRQTSPGQFRVQSCYFSAFYTPEVCQVMSAMDAGIFSGVFSGGALSFTERITEGAKACRANFLPGKGRKKRRGKEQEAK